MALTTERKMELARMTLPSDAEMRQRAEQFRNRMGLTLEEMSLAIGYSSSSVGVFLNGRYGDNLTEQQDSSRNTLNMRAALKQFMDRWESGQQDAAEIAPHVTADYSAVRSAAFNALENGSAYVIDGPPGTQKTFSLRAAEREINALPGRRAVYVYTRVDHAPQGFLREICNAAGVYNRGNIDQLLRKLKGFLSDGRTVLIVDEAQHLAHNGLEVLRQLLDEAGFGVVLAGSHDLTQRLSHWQMEQWRSRVRNTLQLNGPTAKEARRILRAELEPLLGAHTDADCDAVIDGCYATASRMHKSGGKLASRTFTYISARDLFFTIQGIQQKFRSAVSSQQAAPQKESAA